MRRITLMVIALSCLLAACTDSDELLPHSLYFLDGPNEAAQVWRLERDGLTRMQLTDDDAGVDGFAVSQADGTLAFVSNNQLFLSDSDGGNRRLVADGTQVDWAADEYYFRGIISDPVFSPDGQTLAYAFDGLHLYDLATGEDKHVLTNLGNLLGEPFVFVKEIYTPGTWSPDGSQLLIIMSYFEGSTLAVMDLNAEQPFRRLRSEGPVCCLFSWTADNKSVLVANPYFTTDLPGLWRYDAKTGEPTRVVTGLDEDGSINFAGWPRQLPSGELIFFLAKLEHFSPEVGIPLVMVRSNSDGLNLVQVRTEEFHISEVLWTQDGSMALILGKRDEGRQVILARPDASPLEVLIPEGKQIRGMVWGP